MGASLATLSARQYLQDLILHALTRSWVAIKTPRRDPRIGRPTAMSEEVKVTEEVQVEVRAEGSAVAKLRANGILRTEKDELGYLIKERRLRPCLRLRRPNGRSERDQGH